jgi:hypothetical protein
MQTETIGELVRRMESDYVRGNVTLSEHVVFDMNATINKIEAYLNSIHIKGKTDSLGRPKPFFDIGTSAANIWYRATDLDRKHIRIKASRTVSVIDAFLATVHVQNWMTKARFGRFLNEWGRVLSRYGSAVVKFVEKDGELTCSVVPWNRLIVDQIDFDSNPRIEVIELTEAQLKKRKGYDKEMVKKLCDARKVRTTLRGQKKDNKSDYIKLYEIHGELEKSKLTGNDKDEDEYVQQMHVISYVNGKEKGTYDDYTLFSSEEKLDPFMITHLIKEDGRTLAIGAIEHLFQAQWMINHTAKAIKDHLDQASKLFYQTADPSFVGQNVTTAIENGDIMIHAFNKPLTRVNNSSHDVAPMQSQMQMWKSLGNEIVGVSEAMMGAAPKSGTAWRQTEALLQESYSLFEVMTENKALDLEEMFRMRILPYIRRTKMSDGEEIAATLEMNDVEWVDSKYLKNFSIKEANRILADRILKGEKVTPEDQMMLTESLQGGMSESLRGLGNQRFFRPDEIPGNTWKKQFKDLEWDLEVDIVGEAKDYKEAMATLNTALQMILTPGYAENKQAQMVVGKILNLTGTMSSIELSSIPSPMQQKPTGGMSDGRSSVETALAE